ncbi:predicted protein [Arabidopsis lyrata subsp. lyrata]|uniref:Predicted protein n=1 Tax=Arabidopsis lyrata subsp. lyrata TaxID=81972 RepID=D7M3T0_ARALL|nr:predicted protein [Arabidopsis lyrata subsp. lyrata]
MVLDPPGVKISPIWSGSSSSILHPESGPLVSPSIDLAGLLWFELWRSLKQIRAIRLEGAKTVMTSEEASDGRCIKDCRQSKKLLVRIKQTQVIDSSKIYLLIIDGVENDDESNGQKEFYHDQRHLVLGVISQIIKNVAYAHVCVELALALGGYVSTKAAGHALVF